MRFPRWRWPWRRLEDAVEPEQVEDLLAEVERRLDALSAEYALFRAQFADRRHPRRGGETHAQHHDS